MSRQNSGLNEESIVDLGVLQHLTEVSKACEIPAKRWPVIIVHVNYGWQEVVIKIRKYFPCEEVLKASCTKFGLSQEFYGLVLKDNLLQINKNWPVSVLENKTVFLNLL